MSGIARIEPVSGKEIDRRTLQGLGSSAGADQMAEVEVHSAKDPAGFVRLFIGHAHVGGWLHHGPVATAADLLTLDRPYVAHGCFPGDTATVEADDSTYQCIANHGGSAGDWRLLGRASSSATASAISVTPILGLAATDVQAALVELIAQLAGKSPVLIEGSGIAFAPTPDGIVVSATNSGDALVQALAATDWSAVVDGATISIDNSGFGWSAAAAPYVHDHPQAHDSWDDVTDGVTITEYNGGTGWSAAATPYIHS